MNEGSGGEGGSRNALIIGVAVLIPILAALAGGGYLLLSSGGPNNLGSSVGLGRTKTSPTPAPPKHQPLLFAALEQRAGQPARYPPAHDTVVIANLSGNAVAKAAFTPRSIPHVGNAAPLLQPEARTAAGAVYFADGKGVLKLLRPSGSVSQVANFAVNNPQQELAFAVSPDGKAIDATLLTLPPIVPPSPGGPPFETFASGPYHLDLLQVAVGGPKKLLLSNDIPQQTSGPEPILQMVGWDNTGAIATANTGLGTQQGAIYRWFGEAHHLDSSGNFISNSEFGGPGCHAQDALPDATVLCYSTDYRSIIVRDANAQVLWSFPPAPPPNTQYIGPLALSPDGSMVALSTGFGANTGGVYKRDGGRIAYPGNLSASFWPEGWLDSDTVIGTSGANTGPGEPGELMLFHPSTPGKTVDLGFKGNFVGVVQPAN